MTRRSIRRRSHGEPLIECPYCVPREIGWFFLFGSMTFVCVGALIYLLIHSLLNAARRRNCAHCGGTGRIVSPSRRQLTITHRRVIETEDGHIEESWTEAVDRDDSPAVRVRAEPHVLAAASTRPAVSPATRRRRREAQKSRTVVAGLSVVIAIGAALFAFGSPAGRAIGAVLCLGGVISAVIYATQSSAR